MDKRVYSYMDRVRNYFRDKEGYGDTMETKEVLNRILSYTGSHGMGNSEAATETIKLELDRLMELRHSANQQWSIGSEFPITSHRKLIGPVIVFFKKLLRKALRWYINPIIDQQNEFNAIITDNLNEMSNKLQMIEDNFNHVYSDIQASQKLIGEKIYENGIDNEIRLEEIKEWLHDIEKKVQIAKSDLSHLTYRQRKMESNVHTPKEAVNISSSSDVVKHIPDSNSGTAKGTKLDYFLFENRFRGPEASVKETLRQYMRFFTKDNVLDIGCGRGEFLELMSEKELTAKGIDIYKDFVDYCKEKGLDVIESDAVSYLESLEDNSLGGIFLGQVVEHLDKDYLLYLIELAYKKLKAGAYFIAETPNPTMVSTFTSAFYLDISHEKPIHPQTMEFLLTYYGYKDVEILYSENTKVPYSIPELQADDCLKNVTEFNKGINRLNQLIYGYQDYAIVGRK